MQVNWKGVFPAVTTQLNADLTINVAGTQRVADALVRDGVDGLNVLRHGGREQLDGISRESLECLTAWSKP